MHLAQTTSKFPIYDFEGTSYEIGFQHGSKLKDKIDQTIDFYRNVFRQPEDTILNAANHFRSIIKKQFPAYAVEIEAISEAAEVELLWIYALNARTEILTTFIQECTALYFDNGTLGQNWDWAEELEDLAFIARIKQKGFPEILMMTEPGIIGKIGFNSKGIGVCLNFLHFEDQLIGIPIHIMLRILLEANNKEETKEIIKTHFKGKASNILIGFADGTFHDIEFGNEKTYDFDKSSQYFVHTNHYLGNLELNTNDEKLQSSYTRYNRAKSILENSGEFNVDTMKKIFRDTEAGELPICRVYTPDHYVGNVGTVCSIIMELKELKMHYTPGNPFENDYLTIDL